MDLLSSELQRLFPDSRVRTYHRGSAGLYHLFRAIREVRGAGEVVVPNLCCETVALAARYAGHTLRFSDVDSRRLCITPGKLAEAIGPRTLAVVIVHLFGLTVDAADFDALRKEHPGVIFIEDVAHAAGGRDRSQHEVGHGFDHAMFSFSDSKILGGEGGAMVSHCDDEVSARFHQLAPEAAAGEPDPLLALSLRNLVHAIADLHRAGSKGAGNEIDIGMWEHYRPLIAGKGTFLDRGRAASDLRNRKAIARRRCGLAAAYEAAIRHPGLRCVSTLPGETCWRFPLVADGPELRRRATEALRCEGIQVSNHYFPLNRIFTAAPLPDSEALGDRLINLWVDESISEPQVAETARILNAL
jgi:dTDP-4-amino-4,6-dideoxygalactose transaminase